MAEILRPVSGWIVKLKALAQLARRETDVKKNPLGMVGLFFLVTGGDLGEWNLSQ